MVKTDPMLERIRAFDRAHGGGVAIEPVRQGYSLFRAATRTPLARLRPTGQGDAVEILWWRWGRWRSIGDFGGLTMSLDQALHHVANNPLFWSRP